MQATLTFTKEEIEDLLMNLDQCESEGYLNYGNPAYNAMMKLKNVEMLPIDKFRKITDEEWDVFPSSYDFKGEE